MWTNGGWIARPQRGQKPHNRTICCALAPQSRSTYQAKINGRLNGKAKERLMTSAKKNAETVGQERLDLDRRYGKIGISAVAAAVQYQSDSKNLAYAPATLQPLERMEEDDVLA